jgi:DNA polymerase III sliding clamp (beta) subunit (PCNA family)
LDTVTAPAPTALSVQIPLNTAKSIASLSNFASKDKVTPALTVVKMVFTEGALQALATDRYVAIRGSYLYQYDAYGTIYLDAPAVKFITGLKNARYVQFDFDGETLTVSDGSASVSSKMFSGNYPAIETILDKHQPATIASAQTFTIELVTKLAKVIDPSNGKKVERWELEQGLTDVPARPAPLMARATGFTAIIQPNLNKA